MLNNDQIELYNALVLANQAGTITKLGAETLLALDALASTDQYRAAAEAAQIVTGGFVAPPMIKGRDDGDKLVNDERVVQVVRWYDYD